MTTFQLILALLIVKHFLVDAPLQTPYQYMNKGNYGHMGGISHAAYHGFGTMFCFLVFFSSYPLLCFAVGITDAMIHYHIDWFKINMSSNKYSKMTHDPAGKKCLAIYDNKFFLWLVADQCAHFATYLFLVSVPVFNLS